MNCLKFLYDVASGNNCIELEGSTEMRCALEAAEILIDEKIRYCFDGFEWYNLCPDIQNPNPPTVWCSTFENCISIPAPDCSAIGGQIVQSCSNLSSSSSQPPLPSSSSGLPDGKVFCLYNDVCNDTCIPIATETCTALGGQAVQFNKSSMDLP